LAVFTLTAMCGSQRRGQRSPVTYHKCGSVEWTNKGACTLHNLLGKLAFRSLC